MQECYNARICGMYGMDTSMDRFEAVMARLNKSMIHTTVRDKYYAAAVAPSVNDFLSKYISANTPEKVNIVRGCLL